MSSSSEELRIIVNQAGMTQALQGMNNQIGSMQKNIQWLRDNIYFTFQQAMHISRLLIANFKQAAWAQTALAAMELLQSEITWGRIQIHALEAFSTGNWVQGAIYQTLAVAMQAAIFRSQMAQAQANRQQEYLNNMRDLSDCYGA